MRISDWSSYVCSSDLPAPPRRAVGGAGGVAHALALGDRLARDRGALSAGGRAAPAPGTGRAGAAERLPHHRRAAGRSAGAGGCHLELAACPRRQRQADAAAALLAPDAQRSEEHTSELQSLMRI